MNSEQREYVEYLKGWYGKLLETGWTLIDGPNPTFTRDSVFIEFDPVSLISPDLLGLWIYSISKGQLTPRKGMGIDMLQESVFPILEFSDGVTFNVMNLTWQRLAPL